ncbi:MAG: VCBS domain-containing protein [Gallionella sp.]
MKQGTMREGLVATLLSVIVTVVLSVAHVAFAETNADRDSVSSKNPATLNSAEVELTETNEPLSASGSLTDLDNPQTFVAQKKDSKYGTFNITSEGAWTYVTHSALDELKEDQSVSDPFTVSTTDGATTTVKVTITGTNDPAVLSAEDVVLTETNEPLSTSGKLTISDTDNPQTFEAQKKVGQYGTFDIDSTGAWTYVTKSALDNLKVDQTVNDSFTVSSSDGTTTTVKITINGSNDPAILSAANIVLNETNGPLSAARKLSIKDMDSPQIFVAQNNIAGTYGLFNIDSSGAWTYVTNSALDNLKGDQIVSDSFTVTSVDGTIAVVKITINGTNDPAILSAAHVELTETNTPLNTSGKLTIKDIDSPETFLAQSEVAGAYGSFSIDSAGAWSYVTKSALDELKEGQSVTDSFTVSSTDGTTTTVKITINGTNDPAILDAPEVVLTETNVPLKTQGRLSITDVDNPQSFVEQRGVAGTYGTFNIKRAGAWSYVTNSALNDLNVDQNASDNFTVSSADGTTTTVKIIIVGSNDPAILSAADVVLTETNLPLNAGGALTIIDVDSPKTFVVQRMTIGTYGVFNINSAGAWSYVANNALDNLHEGESVTDSFIVRSADGTPTTVKVTINGTNDPAIMSAADVVLTETNDILSTGGTLTIRDADNPESFVAQSNVAGINGVFNINAAGAWTYVTNSALDELNVGRSAGDIFNVTSADGTTATVKITINGTNDPATMSSADVVLTETNVPLSAGGKLTISDLDNPESFEAQNNVAGAYGTFSIDPAGAWSYVTNSALDELLEDQVVTDSFTVTGSEGKTTTVKVTINGTNDPAVLDGTNVVLTETNAPLTTGGTLTIKDVDSPQSFVERNKAGKYGTFNIDSAGAWTYVAKSAFDNLQEGQSVSDSFIVTSADGTTTIVKITIQGNNDPAILGAADIELTESNVPLKAQGKLSIKDVDSPQTFVEQSEVAGTYGIFNIDSAGVWSYVTKSALEELKKDQTVNDNFTISSADGTTTSVKITIHGTGPSEFRGKYFGVKLGINNSSASGGISAPSASTFAYVLQGGYLQGGYNWDLRVAVVGVGAYFDWNSYEKHTNGIAYGSRAYGIDAKAGLPVGDWLPYFKVGYGYSTGSRDLRSVSGNGFNGAIGFEYNFAFRWGAVAEYKRSKFSNQDGSTTINNKTFTFGLNYFFDIPKVIEKVKAPEAEIILPEAVLAPEALPEAPPAP